jgi:hypothetical protein
LAYNLANFLPRLTLPKSIRHGSLTLQEKLVKIGTTVTRHSNYVTFQLAQGSVTRNLFTAILNRIARLAMPPPVVVDRMPAWEYRGGRKRPVSGQNPMLRVQHSGNSRKRYK